MADLSKIRLNGTVYNFKDSYARNLPLATTTSNGLMAATDKQVIDNLNPNVTVNITDWYDSDLEVINAKQANALDFEIKEPPHISSQIRTSNLLNVDSYTPGLYIGANGATASNANDKLGEFIPVTPGQDIYYTGIVGQTNSSSINRRLHVYTANQTWIKQLSFASSLHIGDNWSTHGVIPSNGAYIRVSWGSNDVNVMLSVGAPVKYEPYYLTPFEPLSSISFQLANNSEMENANTYTINIPSNIGDVYSCNINPIEGKLYLTSGHISSYNDEILPGRWWSDRDTYSEESSPTLGAEVVYELDSNNITEYDIVSINIPLFYHCNHFHVNSGEIIKFSYYAETFALSHLTITNGITFGDNQITENTVNGWNHAADLIDTKAPIESPVFTGNASSITTVPTANSDRIATTAFVQRKFSDIIANNENTGKATTNYNIGDYITVNGTLYKVISAIPNGATISVGTNVQVTTVTDELKLLFSLIV